MEGFCKSPTGCCAVRNRPFSGGGSDFVARGRRGSNRAVSGEQESLREVYEIADLIIPGHDNIFANPHASGM